MGRLKQASYWTFATLGTAFFLIAGYSYFVSRHRIFWSDELFGWMLVTDPSWRHMLRAWNLGADGGGIGFYVLCRIWLKIFGQSAIMFRAFSAAGVFAGFAGVWFSLRRFYRPAISALVLFIVWFSSRIILWQIVQTRFYGMLLGAAGWSLYVVLRSAADADALRRLRKSTLVLTFIVNLLLVSAHPFGIVYSALLLGSGLLDDWFKRRRRDLFYVAAILPWTVLIFSRTALENSARVGKPWFWTIKPHLSELQQFYIPDYAPTIFYLTLIMAAIVVASLFWKAQRTAIWNSISGQSSIILPAFLIMLVPTVFWLLSQGSTSYFVDRYMVPLMIGVAVLVAEMLTQLFPRPFSRNEPMPLLIFITFGLFAGNEVYNGCLMPYKRDLLLPPKDFTGQLVTLLPRHEPVVFQRADLFDLMLYYRNAPDLNMLLPLDWKLAIAPTSPRWLVSAHHEMENWKLAGYYSDHIVDSDSFLSTTSRFAVVADDNGPWFRERILHHPGWQVEKISEYRNGYWSCTLWQVTH